MGYKVIYKVETKYGVVNVKNFTARALDLKNAVVLARQEDILFFDAGERRVSEGGQIAC